MNDLEKLAPGVDTSYFSTFELQFLKAYVENHGNGTEAYLLLKPDVSRESACTLASKIVNSPAAQEYLKAYKDELVRKTSLTKETLIEYTSYGLERCKINDEMGTLFKGVEVAGKLIGAYESGLDDAEKYSGLISKIRANNVQININK